METLVNNNESGPGLSPRLEGKKELLIASPLGAVLHPLKLVCAKFYLSLIFVQSCAQQFQDRNYDRVSLSPVLAPSLSRTAKSRDVA